MDALNTSSVRAREARLGKRIGKSGATGLAVAAVLLTTIGLWLVMVSKIHIGFVLLSPAILAAMVALWWFWELSVVPPTGSGLNERLHRDVLTSLKPSEQLSPKQLWRRLQPHWQAVFFCNHLLIAPDLIAEQLSDNPTDVDAVWPAAVAFADAAACEAIEPGHVVAALLAGSPQMQQLLVRLKFHSGDIQALNDWLGRDLAAMRRTRQSFGGIGRDWAHGFTPRLNQFGRNLSLGIERSGAHYGTMMASPGVTAIRGAFSQGAGAVALVGDDGIGKTSYAHALAQTLLAESHDPHLEHRQLIALNPSPIISAAQRPGDLEYIVSVLLNEAARAGHIILFFDDAQLFFSNGPGTFNATQILLPFVQNRAVQMVFAMTPHDYQTLKLNNPNFASLLTPVILQEPPEKEIMQSLEDAATNFEIRHRVLIPYETLREAYRLSGRYDTDMAYPGKAIRLLEQSLSHAENGIITVQAIHTTVEQTRGVKVGTAAPAEADQLLNLEDQIHSRMINQSRAVNVVASALRRSRAGVANPKRPIGSFLFLGPTGTGKTELARSIAATYFRNEQNMIRLDMSEFQQESDVSRILSAGQNEASSLLLQVRQQPFSVVLLDEIEKAHPNILNLLLQLLDEGQLTDSGGRAVSFKDCVIIATSNAGADTIRERIEQGQPLESFEQEFTDQLIGSGQFKPELLNRFDEIVLFRPLTPDELGQVVRLMLAEVNKTLSNQNIVVELTDAAVAKIVDVGNDPRLGARPMRRALQRAVEDTVAQRILRGEVHPGDRLTLDAPDLAL